MQEVPELGLTEAEFKDALEKLVEGKTAKIWLAKGAGHRVDTVFSIGTAKSDSVKLFDRIDGLFLLGEGVPPKLLPKIHQLFEAYSQTHKGRKYRPSQRVVILRCWPDRGTPTPHERKPRATMHDIGRLSVHP